MRLVLSVLLLAILSACVKVVKTPVRSFVVATDNIIRDKTQPADMIVLLEPPLREHRVIARLVGYGDAHEIAQEDRWATSAPDAALWAHLRARAAAIGAHAVVAVNRSIVPCTKAGYVSSSTVANDYGAASATEAVGPRHLECVQILADAVILGGSKDYSCDMAQNCRDDRQDASELRPKKGLLEFRRPSESPNPAAGVDDGEAH